jgi:hypothetical protein
MCSTLIGVLDEPCNDFEAATFAPSCKTCQISRFLQPYCCGRLRRYGSFSSSSPVSVCIGPRDAIAFFGDSLSPPALSNANERHAERPFDLMAFTRTELRKNSITNVTKMKWQPTLARPVGPTNFQAHSATTAIAVEEESKAAWPPI